MQSITFNPTRKIGSMLSFDQKEQMIKINHEYYSYDEIKSFQCVEKKETCKINDEVKDTLASVLFTMTLGSPNFYPEGHVFKKEVEQIIELKFEFKIKGRPQHVILDLLENEEEQVISDSVKYQYYKKLKNDIDDALNEFFSNKV